MQGLGGAFLVVLQINRILFIRECYYNCLLFLEICLVFGDFSLFRSDESARLLRSL